jgi:glycosyltransferase involved in cell wall biosynthesis
VFTRADAHDERVAMQDEITRLANELARTRALNGASATRLAGRVLARTVRRSGVGAAGAVKRRTRRSVRNPIRAYEAALATGQPWQFPPRDSYASGASGDSGLGSLIECLGPREQALGGDSLDRLEGAIVDTRWTDDEVLETRRFSWEERQAIVEADAVARLVRRSIVGASPRSVGGRGGDVVVDTRCLQDPAYRGSTVEIHGRVVLAAARAVASHRHLVLLTSAESPPLPPGIMAEGDEVLATPYPLRERDVALFVEVSPMTASAAPATPMLARRRPKSAAVVLELGSPHSSALDALTSRLRVEALRHYDLLLPISGAAAEALRGHAGGRVRSEVTGLADPLADVPPGPRTIPGRFALIPTAGDTRADVPAAITALALARRRGPGDPLRAVVTGRLSAAEADALRNLADSVGLGRDILEFIGDADAASLASLYFNAEVVIVLPLVADGFSLPILRAVTRDTPVVASDVPAHRELFGGDGGDLVSSSSDIERLARAIDFACADGSGVAARQRDAFVPITGPADVQARIEQALEGLLREPGPSSVGHVRRRNRPRLAFVAPLPPQRTGVGDYTAYTLRGVSEFADVEVFTTADMSAPRAFSTSPLSAAPYLDNRFDKVVSVVGNSHFHFPILDFLASYGSATIAHDTRMVEVYVLERGVPWVADFLSTEARTVKADEIGPMLNDMDQLPSTAYDMIAKQSSPLIVHGNATAERIFRETGVRPEVAPFVPYNLPPTPAVRAPEIRNARRALRLAEGTYHLAAFGIVDRRTKGTDLIISAVSRLRRWGIPVHLHVVGDAPPAERDAIAGIVDALGVASAVTMHGRVSHEDLVRFLLAADVAVHLRTSGLLSLSGSVADCAAFGVPTVATRELVDELGAPEYFEPVDTGTGAMLVAEAVQRLLRRRRDDPDAIEIMRRAYVNSRSLDIYARRLLDAIGLPVT